MYELLTFQRLHKHVTVEMLIACMAYRFEERRETYHEGIHGHEMFLVLHVGRMNRALNGEWKGVLKGVLKAC